jgi:hypothetical protein
MAKKTDNTTMVSRPRRKADHSVKGTMKTWEGTDYCEFHPVGKRESNRTELKRVGDSSFYQTKGEKESSFSIHINVDGSSADPVNEAREIFNVLTAEQAKQKPTLSEGSEGRMLLDDGNGLQVWLDTAKGEVNILARLECSPQIERMLLQAQATMNVTVGRYRQEILNHEKKTTDITDSTVNK